MYFLKKLYCEFVLGEIPNYFDIVDSQDRGGGSSFERSGARHDPNVVRAPVVHPQHENVIIPSVVKEHVEANTLGTINALMQTLIHSMSPLVEGELLCIVVTCALHVDPYAHLALMLEMVWMMGSSLISS